MYEVIDDLLYGNGRRAYTPVFEGGYHGEGQIMGEVRKVQGGELHGTELPFPLLEKESSRRGKHPGGGTPISVHTTLTHIGQGFQRQRQYFTKNMEINVIKFENKIFNIGFYNEIDRLPYQHPSGSRPI
jgi:hypothetical protein